jgi:hypothetical protein
MTNLPVDRNAPTPASFWTYQASSATPSYWEALECGAIKPNMTESGWQSLTPGMRREIVRSHLKKVAS